MDKIYSLLVWLPGSVLVLVLMSMARAHVANMLGDPTARRMGLLGLNPVNHIDPVGTLAIPAALALVGAPIFGWGKGMPIDPDQFPRPRPDSAVVAASGPVVALLIAAIAAATLGAIAGPTGELTPATNYFIDSLIALLTTGCMLAVFNLLPIPGFAGGTILEALLPRKLADDFEALRVYSFPILIGLIVVMPMISPQLDIFRAVVVPIASLIIDFFAWGAGIGTGG